MATRRESALEYSKGILTGDVRRLSQAITLAESALAADQLLAEEILQACRPLPKNTLRIGITGAPGVGKSTFIEAFGLYLTGLGKRLAVLAVDPSSSRSRGSILGDKTRMAELSRSTRAYIRPTAAGHTLGGTHSATPESILLVEAAGYDLVIVETVGVGQSETQVRDMVDVFLLLLQPGGGDELQGMKRGIVELADLLVINKADGTLREVAEMTRQDYAHAISLLGTQNSIAGWVPEVLACSALTGSGLVELWQALERYQTLSRESGYFAIQRRLQLKRAFQRSLEELLKQKFLAQPAAITALAKLEQEVVSEALTPRTAARRLVEEL